MEEKHFLENEAEIVKQAKTDDRAFEVLYNHYFSRIYAFVIKRTSQRETAEDIVSEVFMKAFAHLEKYEIRDCTFGAWLYRIAANKVIDHYRKEGKRKIVSIEDRFDLRDENVDISLDIDLKLQADQIKYVLERLKPPKYQTIVHLKFFGELSNMEIAEVMGMNPNSTGVLLCRALKKFKKIFDTKSSLVSL